MRKEMLCVVGVLLGGCWVQAQQWSPGSASPMYYQGPVQTVQMAQGAANGGYAPQYYPNNYGYVPAYPANYGYGSGYGYGATQGYPVSQGYRAATQGYPVSQNAAGSAPAPIGVPVVTDLPAVSGVVPDAPAGDPEPVASAPLAGGPAPNDAFWFDIGYVLASLQRGPLQTPLVTIGSIADPRAGALGQPNTAVVFGGNGLTHGLSHGITAGGACSWTRSACSRWT